MAGEIGFIYRLQAHLAVYSNERLDTIEFETPYFMEANDFIST